jgi:hypothetical protein
VAPTRTLEKLVESYPRDVQAVAAGAKHLICDLLLGVEERVDPKHAIVAYGYGPGYRGMVCTLLLSKSGVKLGIVRGSELADPRGLLQGSGKVHRFVQLHAPADLRKAGLRPLIKAAHVAWQARQEK